MACYIDTESVVKYPCGDVTQKNRNMDKLIFNILKFCINFVCVKNMG
jgi:hypothetical protein